MAGVQVAKLGEPLYLYLADLDPSSLDKNRSVGANSTIFKMGILFTTLILAGFEQSVISERVTDNLEAVRHHRLTESIPAVARGLRS